MTDQSIHQLRVAAVQLNSTADTAANLAQAEGLVRAAADDGAELVLLPEKWSVLGGVEELVAGAEPLDGPAIERMRSLAAELSIDLVAGSIAERTEEGHANTSAHIAPDGEIVATYRKVHMFDVVVDGVTYNESDLEAAGEEIVTTRTVGGVELGMSVCYDLRFPELFRILTLRGARVLLVPAAFTFATTRDHWEVLLRARAIENQAFVVAANQIGEHPPKYRSGGRSMIVDPWGLVLASAPDRVTHITATLDLREQDRIRAQLPALRGRRPEVYRWPEEVRS